MSLEKIEAREQAVKALLKPSPALLCKLASVAVHADEMLSADGHDFDRLALGSSLSDPEVRDWLDAMAAASLAPLRRVLG